MKITFLLPFLLFVYSATSQNIEGVIKDTEGMSLPFATVQLLKSDSSLQKIETSAANGFFRFANLPTNTYYLAISFIGYESFFQKVELNSESINLGTVKLKVQSTALKEITITEEKLLIQVEPDKTIFNVSKNLASSGDDGIELLRKAPGIQVDNNDNIILEGKTGVAVYINGKQSFLQGEDLNIYLRSLRAEDIESIEIITQPSSKYDAAGSAGIVNIVLKREKGLGTKGSITNTLTIGDFARNNSSLSLNHRNKRMALFGSYSHYQGKSTNFMNFYRSQGVFAFDSENEFIFDGRNDNIRLGGDYYLTKKSTLGVAVSGNLNKNRNRKESFTRISDIKDNEIDSILSAFNQDKSNVENYTANLNYHFEDTSGRSFSVDLDYVNYENVTISNQPNFYLSPNQQQTLSQNINYQETPITIEVYSAKSDYERKIRKGVAAMGIKYSEVNTNNIFDFYNVEGGERSLSQQRSNVFDYQEVIYAGYFNYKFDYKKFKLQAGLRAEQTNSEGDLKAANSSGDKQVRRSYFNWFPSAGLTYAVNQNNTTALVYGRRIQRPNYQNLNPFETQLNELSFRKGNPFLQPQFTDNIKLSNTYKYKLTTSFTYSYILDYFAEVTEADGEKRNFINTRNVADQETYNFNVSYPAKLSEWLNVYGNAYLYHTSYTANNPDFIPIEQTVYGFYAQATFSLPLKLKAEMSGWYSSPSIWRGTYETKSIGALNLALQRKWRNWSAKVSFNDVLYTIPWRAETRFGSLYINGSGGRDSRNVRFFASYSFGSNDVKESRRRTSGAEDEKDRIGS